jgi:hypothetical protein
MNELTLQIKKGQKSVPIKVLVVVVGVCVVCFLVPLAHVTRLRVNFSACEKRTAALATNSKNATEAFRMAMRRASRYGYQPPEPRNAGERQAAADFCGPGPTYASYWNQPTVDGTTHRSVNNEDKTIFEQYILPLSIPNGTYVEVGAYNGLTASNSRFFDLCLGWNGILVEANSNPHAFPQLVANRPYAHRFNMAASCDDNGYTRTTVGFHTTKEMNSAQADVNSAYKGVTHVDYALVACGSLTPLLLDLFPKGRVTFFSLDVEGAEAKVVKALDFDKVFIELMIVSNANDFCPQEPAECESRNEYRSIMANAGYKLITNDVTVANSDLFIHPRSIFMKLIL